MWRPPSSSWAACMKTRACSSSDTSTSLTSAGLSKLSASASSRSVRRAPSATPAPAADRARAVAAPIPDEAPVTAATRPSRGPGMRPWMLPGEAPRPQGQLQLEAGIRVVEARAEQLAQARQAVAHGLRMHVQRLRDRLGAAPVAEPRVERGAEPLARQLRLALERREGGVGDVAGQAPVDPEQQGKLVALRKEQPAAVLDAAVARQAQQL